MKKLALIIPVLLLTTSVLPAMAQEPEVEEFDVPSGARPHDVAPAPDGSVWYTAQRQGALGTLDPETGEYRQIPLGAGSAPHGVIVGPDGHAWVTDGGLNAIVNGDDNMIGDPLFVGSGSYDLLAGSAAIDTGMESNAYQTFINHYAQGIRIDIAGTPRPQNADWDVGAYEFAPSLILTGFPRNQSIRLAWAVNITIPLTATWQITYLGPQGDLPSPITGITNTARAYHLTGMTNYVPYTVTLNAVQGSSPILTDTVVGMPTDQFVYLPMTMRD